MTPEWIRKEQWVALDAPLQNGPRDRHPAKLAAVINQFQFESAERYRPVETISASGQKSIVTWCNVAVCDATKALGCAIPRIIERNGAKHEQRANDIHLWLLGTAGRECGWWAVSELLAARIVAVGCPVVATWYNDLGGPGHLAMLKPAMDPAPSIEGALQLATGALYSAQAGAECWSHNLLERGFGLDKKPVFAAHA